VCPLSSCSIPGSIGSGPRFFSLAVYHVIPSPPFTKNLCAYVPITGRPCVCVAVSPLHITQLSEARGARLQCWINRVSWLHPLEGKTAKFLPQNSDIRQSLIVGCHQPHYSLALSLALPPIHCRPLIKYKVIIFSLSSMLHGDPLPPQCPTCSHFIHK
jgi:hypothetical protein